MDVINYEKYIIKLLFTDPDARDKLFSFVDPELFDEDFSHSEIIKIFIRHKDKYGKFASCKEMLSSIENDKTFEAFKEIINYDVSDVSEEFIQEEAAEFFRQKMIMNNTLSSIEKIKNSGTDKITDFPDKIREALSFSFDTNVGLDLFQDSDRLYKSLHETDNVISSGLTDLDNAIKGGFHEKTLTLFIAECVTGDTKIKIRRRRKNK